MTRKQLISKPHRGYRNKSMDAKTWLLRQRVMKHIYSAKTLLKGDMPRVDVRIVEGGDDTLRAYAALGGRVIWITEDSADLPRQLLERIVFHELVHALTGFGHDDNCPLMTSQGCVNSKMSQYEQEEAFLKYFR